MTACSHVHPKCYFYREAIIFRSFSKISVWDSCKIMSSFSSLEKMYENVPFLEIKLSYIDNLKLLLLCLFLTLQRHDLFLWSFLFFSCDIPFQGSCVLFPVLCILMLILYPCETSSCTKSHSLCNIREAEELHISGVPLKLYSFFM